MKCLIVSDSHGLSRELIELVSRHKHEIDVWIHCGDSELSGDDEAILPFNTVQGNCDFGTDFPAETIVPFDKHNIYVTHGHLYKVKSTILNLAYRGQEIGADIVCFGHSHIAGAEKIDDCLYINPGSIRLPRGSKHKTYAILTVEDQKATVDFYTVSGQHLPDWKLETSLS